jgi:PAS domain S-box-containing protein
MTEPVLKAKGNARRSKKSILSLIDIRSRELLAKLPAGAYTCDTEGLITYYNHHAVELWGREPALNDPVDRFCGSFKLYAIDGTPIAHDRCWMALALTEERAFDGKEIMIERPDGTRVTALAHANPIRDEEGKMIGAVNVLIDISDRKLAENAQGHLAAIVDSSDDAIVSKTLEGFIQSWNSGAERIFGYTAAEAIGQHISLIIPPERLSEEDLIISKLRAGERVAHFNTVRIAKSGRRVDISITVSPVRDAHGNIIGASKVARDISESKKLEEEMGHANMMLSTLIEASPLAIAVIDFDPPIVRLWNPAAEKLFGWKASEILGQPLPIVPKDRFKEFEEYRAAFSSGKALHDIETYRKTRNGALVQVSLSAAPLFDKGHISGVVGIFTDMTARKKVENALRNASRTKDEFLATLAHELRNPLAPLRNAIEILEIQGVPTPESKWALGIMSRQMRQMTRLIDDLLDIARITGNKLELKKEVIELSDVIRIAVETSKPLIESSGHQFSMDMPEETVCIKGDQVRIAQAVSNLLNNAAKYTESGGSIWLSAERQGHEIVITVRDTGVGISAEMLPHIFDMFRQSDRSGASKGGLGIGLTLAKRLIRMHGGSIQVESKGAGKGSSFSVRLPIVTRSGETEDEPKHEVSLATAPMRILIVDDNEDSVSTLNMMLRLAGHDIRTARDGIGAVDLANTFRPNVVLLDIGMPRMNGYEAAATIRKQWWGEDMTLIAMTGWGQTSDRMKSKEAGFDEHLVKPVDPRALMRLLKRIEENKPVSIAG